MFRLSREVRFAIDLTTAEGRPVEGRNGYAGKPPITGIGQVYYALSVTLEGEPQAGSGYLINIKCVDDAVRDNAVPLVKRAVRRVVGETCTGDGTGHLGGGGLVRDVFVALEKFAPHRLQAVELALSPLTSLAVERRDLNLPPMTYLRHTFEFAASHRLHNPALSDEENRRTFGKCNNPHGHGHNYQLMVTLRGEPDADGFLINFYDLEAIVDDSVIAPFDHKHLNVEVDEFRDGVAGRMNPSVENIAKAIYSRLKTALAGQRAELDAVTVWETPKTWCEYREEGSPASAQGLSGAQNPVAQR